jgi:hypothetical protein
MTLYNKNHVFLPLYAYFSMSTQIVLISFKTFSKYTDRFSSFHKDKNEEDDASEDENDENE